MDFICQVPNLICYQLLIRQSSCVCVLSIIQKKKKFFSKFLCFFEDFFFVGVVSDKELKLEDGEVSYTLGGSGRGKGIPEEGDSEWRGDERVNPTVRGSQYLGKNTVQTNRDSWDVLRHIIKNGSKRLVRSIESHGLGSKLSWTLSGVLVG